MSGRGLVIFLGPSLDLKRAKAILPDAVYLPPVSQGDVVRACHRHAPRGLVIVDGVFDSVPAVRHKEILWALDRGIGVVGSSSMGAMRAAELAPFGMEGFGMVYRWYRATALADDDEVAVLTGPVELGWTALSDALFDMRLTFRKAARHRVITPARARQLAETACQIHFSQRTYRAVLARSRDRSNAGFAEWLAAGGRHSQKTKDAEDLLHHLAFPGRAVEGFRASATLERHLTLAWWRDLETSGIAGHPSSPAEFEL